MKLPDSDSKIFVILRRLVLLALIIGALTNIAYPSWQKIMDWRLTDNDDVMRVLQVRAWLNGQGFYDLVNHRLNPPDGGFIHWSRLADLPLVFTNLILRPLLGLDFGEKTAVFITPLLLGAVFAVTMGKTAYTIEKSRIAFFMSCLVALSTAGAMGYFTAGRVDHHGLQLIFMVLSFAGLFAHDKKGAMISGLSMGSSLTIGFEMIPIIAIMIAWVAIAWAIRGEESKDQAMFLALSLAIGTIFGFLINVPPSRYLIAENDALSIAELAPICIGSSGLILAAHFLSNKSIALRFVSLGLIGVAVIACSAQFPVLLQPIYWQTPPILRRMWLGAVSETHPLLKSEIPVQLNLGLFAVIGSIVAIVKLLFVARSTIKNPDLDHKKELDNWSLIAVTLLCVTIMSIFWQARVAGQASTIAGFMGSALVTNLYKKYGIKRALMLGLILNPLLPSAAASAYSKAFPKKSKYAVGGGASCKGIKAFSELAKMPKGLVAAPIDFGAHTLISTHHDVLAAPYHRNQGNMLAYQIFMAKADDALPLIHARGVQYVAICTKSAEVRILSNESPNGLMANLRDLRWPDYLEPIPTPKGSNINAYKVVK